MADGKELESGGNPEKSLKKGLENKLTPEKAPNTMPDNEESKLIDDLSQKDLFKDPGTVEDTRFNPPEEKTESDEEKSVVGVDESKLTRRMERRQAEKIRQLRDENIALNERLKFVAEQKPTTEDADYLKRIEEIYGNADEKGNYDPRRVKATEILKSVISDVRKESVQEALKEFESRQQAVSQQEQSAITENEDYLQEAMDEVEQTYGINMDSPKERNAYLELLEEMSPKDKEGNISEYADPEAVAKMFVRLRNTTTQQQKQIVSRSMTPSGQGKTTIAEDATLRFLKENDLI